MKVENVKDIRERGTLSAGGGPREITHQSLFWSGLVYFCLVFFSLACVVSLTCVLLVWFGILSSFAYVQHMLLVIFNTLSLPSLSALDVT